MLGLKKEFINEKIKTDKNIIDLLLIFHFNYKNFEQYGMISINPFSFKKKFDYDIESVVDLNFVDVLEKENGFFNINIIKKDEFLKDFYFLFDRICNKKNQLLNVEFGSINPTGRLHLGHIRNLTIGVTITKLLKTLGYEITTEYLWNDHGNQIEQLLDFEDNNYQSIKKEYIANYNREHERNNIVEYTKKVIIDEIKNYFKFNFDIFTSQLQLQNKYLKDDRLIPQLEQHLNKLKVLKDKAIEIEGYRKRILFKTDGTYTYFLIDILYLWDLYSRNIKNKIIVVCIEQLEYLQPLIFIAETFGIKFKPIFYQEVRFENTTLSKRNNNDFKLDENLIVNFGFIIHRYKHNTIVNVKKEDLKSPTNNSITVYNSDIETEICIMFSLLNSIIRFFDSFQTVEIFKIVNYANTIKHSLNPYNRQIIESLFICFINNQQQIKKIDFKLLKKQSEKKEK